jgi:hypothetical protein
MNKKWIGIGLGVVAVAMVVLFATKVYRAPVAERKEPQDKAVSSSENFVSDDMGALREKKKTQASEVARDTGKTNSVSAPESLLKALHASYESGGVVSRIRLQEDLKQLWQQNPPSAQDLTELIGDEDAPAEFRVYIAKVFRNEVKRRKFDADATNEAFASLRRLVADDNWSADFRADLANILTTVDQSDETIRAVSPLLEQNDAVAVKAVSALCNTANPLAIDTLHAFVTENPEIIETNPRALAAALPPLATTEKDVLPVIERAVNETDDFDLYRAAVQALMHTESSPAVLDAVAQAYAAAPRFGARQKHAEHLCQAAARKHSRYFESNKDRIDRGTEPVIEGMLQPEDGK